MNIVRIGAGALLALGFGASAFAQAVPFQFILVQGTTAVAIQNGSTITLVASVGQSQTVTVKATYTGTGQATILQQPDVFGSSAFAVSVTQALPLTLLGGEAASISIQFQPSSASSTTAQISLPYSETLPATGPGTTPTTNTGALGFVLQGSVPAFTLSYVSPVNQNVLGLLPGATIPFLATLVGSSSQIALNLTNTGTAAGTVTGLSITGSAFHLQGVPLLPATVQSGQNLQILVVYTPAAIGTDTGQLTVTFGSGAPITLNLSGSGGSPALSYQLLTSPPATVSPGGTIALPSANVGQTTSLTIQVLNSGSVSDTVSTITLSGSGFQLSGVPALPQTLAPNASLTFTVNFTASQPGTVSGTLIVNSDTFMLSGTGLGPLLTFSYTAGGNTIAVGAANTGVVFSPVMISQSEQLSFTIQNVGTLPATVSNIGIGQANSPYTLVGVPQLPLTLAPNASSSILIVFTPVALGFVSGSLVVDITTVSLVGSGTQPPPLPSYTISGPSGNGTPMTQPAVGLTLASPYPVTLSGTLTITVTGTLPADPAVQFATGGRTVSFSIPANQTAAVFAAQGTQLGIQTGTVAGTIVLTPSFATQAGNVDVTPVVPSTLQFAIAPAAPTLIAVQVTGQSATLTTTAGAIPSGSFTVQVSGFATTRTLTSVVVQFSLAPGFSMPTSEFTIDVGPTSSVWFQSTASLAFGSQFTVSIPFTFQGAVGTGKSVLSAIASVSATASNELGASSQVQVTLQ